MDSCHFKLIELMSTNRQILVFHRFNNLNFIDNLLNKFIILGILVLAIGLTPIFTLAEVETLFSPIYVTMVSESNPNDVSHPPSNLEAVVIGSTLILLWDKSNDITIDNYRIISDPPYTPIPELVSVRDDNPNGHIIIGLTPGTLYTFNVIAVNDYGDSEPSNSVTDRILSLYTIIPSELTNIQITPSQPANLEAKVFGSTLLLEWDKSDDDSITGYKVFSDPPYTPTPELIPFNPITYTNGHVIGGLSPDISYTFHVIAVNDYGDSEPSNSVTARVLYLYPLPDPPIITLTN